MITFTGVEEEGRELPHQGQWQSKVGKGLEALAKKRKIASEGIALTATDTTGKLSAASFTVKKPH